MEKKLIDWLFVAKGIGIILVVIGHFHPQNSPEYWNKIVAMIYTFHMPLFFLLSGYLFIYSDLSVLDLVRSKVQRLVYPFLTISLCMLLIKYIAGFFVALEFPLNVERIVNLIVDPVNSYIPLLWFIHALLFVMIICRFFSKFVNIYVFLVISLIICLAGGGGVPFFGKSLQNLPFFICGIVYRQNEKSLSYHVGDERCCALVVLLFVSLLWARMSSVLPGELSYLLQFLIGLAGCLMVVGISRIITGLSGVFFVGLRSVGFYSMTIYLLHTVFESSIRIIGSKIVASNNAYFEIIAMSAILCGIIIPLYLERNFFRNYSFSRKYILGLC